MIIVAAILERGDVFLRGNVKYKVVDVSGTHVYYSCVNKHGHSTGGKYAKAREFKIGKNSKEKMILVADCDYGDPKNLKQMFYEPQSIQGLAPERTNGTHR
jgi:hypothetical protein